MVFAEQGFQSSDLVAFGALGLSVLSFYWVNFRRGSLLAARPGSFACVLSSGHLLLRLPIAIYNTGAASIVVEDLRLAVVSPNVHVRWGSTKRVLGPKDGDHLDVASPFAVEGRKTASMVAQFRASESVWTPDPDQRYCLRVEYQTMRGSTRLSAFRRSQRTRWKTLVEFDWWLPDHAQDSFVAHRNDPGGCRKQSRDRSGGHSLGEELARARNGERTDDESAWGAHTARKTDV